MIETEKLLKLGVFNTAEAEAHHISRQSLFNLVKSDRIRKIGPDVYCHPKLKLPEDKLQWIAACKIFGKDAYISGPSVLFTKNLVEQPPHAVWVITGPSKTTANTIFQIIRTKIDKNHGVEQHGWYRAATVERAILDALHFKTKIGGAETGIISCRKAVREGMTDLGRIMRLAKELGWQKKVLEFWEALSVE